MNCIRIVIPVNLFVTLVGCSGFLLISCGVYPSPPSENTTPQNQHVKPIITTPCTDTTFPLIFEAAFEKGTAAKQDHMKYTFEMFSPGKIKIESGKIIACDPVNMSHGISFSQQFPIGEFPVELALAKTDQDMRVALARIVFSDSTVIRWEFALQPGEKPISILDSTTYCFPDDAGQFLFIDSIANDHFPSKDWDAIFADQTRSAMYTGSIHQFSEHNLATFCSGYGDGCYCVYIGYDKSGNVCKLLADFGLVEWWNLK